MHVSGGQIEAAFNSVVLVESRLRIIYRPVYNTFIPQSGSMFCKKISGFIIVDDELSKQLWNY